jgi:hypothetical protein
MIAPKPLPKPRRLPKETRLTICAAFMSSYGIVMCADSQETVGVMKFDAPKLTIRPEPSDPEDKVRMIFAGAGHGPFIDKLVDKMWEAASSGSDMSTEAVVARVEEANIEWHKKIWEAYGNTSRPEAEILFAIYVQKQPVDYGEEKFILENPVSLYRASGPIISRIESFGFVGVGGELGHYLAEHIRTMDDIENDIGTGLYILANAKKYVDGCGGPTQLAVLMIDGSIHTISAHDASSLEDGISKISAEVHYLLSSVLDVRMNKTEINATARNTAKEIQVIRSEMHSSAKRWIRVPRRLKNSMKQVYIIRKKWPPVKVMPSAPHTSEDQP